MNLEKYLDVYTNVSREELEKYKDIVCRGRDLDWCDRAINWHASFLHKNREKVKLHGRPALSTISLIHVVSVRVQPQEKVKPLAIYGKIGVEFPDFRYGGIIGHEFYKRDHNTPQFLDTSGTLILNGPHYSCDPLHAYMPLFKNKIDVELFYEDDNIFAFQSFSLEDNESESDYEEVKSKVINCEQGTLIMDYIVIPFGVYCRLEVMFSNRRKSEKHDSVLFNGKVGVRYTNTCGSYVLEENILFEKQAHEYQRVEINQNMQLARYWVALPAHSFLVVDLDLSEFETGRKIVNDTMKFLPQSGWMSGNTFLLDDFCIEVSMAWFTPSPMGPQYEKFSCNTEEIPMEEDIDGEDEFSCNTEEIPMEEDIDGEDESSSDESPSNLNCTWGLRSHTNKPWPSHAVEIFSVFIGQEMSKALQTRNLRIYGSIEVVYDDDRICSIFKRDVNCALELLEPMKSTIDVLDGSRAYEECSLEIKLDIKDVEDRLAIKGYVDWEASVLEKSLWRDKQLCNVFQGQNGFAAVHYSIFSEAVQAAIKVSINFKMGDGPQKACGSLIAQYNCFDYSSRYNKEYYRIVLFRRIEEDSVGLNADSTLPLSRSVVVVPAYSSLVIDADLDLSGQKILCTKEIEIGEGYKTIETNDCVIHFELAWCEIK